ncbi:unnamed protein product [Prunus armeniaca]
MESGRSFFTLPSWFVIVAILVVGLSGGSYASDDGTNFTSSCGNIHNIGYPFGLKHDPNHCGNSYFSLSCEKNITLLNLPSGEYYVQAINYHNRTIRLLDPGLQKDNCSSIPRYPLALMNRYRIIYTDDHYGDYILSSTPVTFLKCANPVNSSIYVDTAPCISTTSLSSQPKTYGYFMIGWTNASDFAIGCSVEWTTAMLDSYNNLHQNASCEYIHNALLYGFDLGYGLGNYSLCKSGWDRFFLLFPNTTSSFFHHMALRFHGT